VAKECIFGGDPPKGGKKGGGESVLAYKRWENKSGDERGRLGKKKKIHDREVRAKGGVLIRRKGYTKG